MNKHKQGSIEYLSFQSLDEITGVKNLFTTRLGGVSSGYHESMNLGFSNGDDSKLVEQNFGLMADVIGVSPDHIICSKQTHTTNVIKITEDNCTNDGKLAINAFNDVDGLMTNVTGIALACFFADCVPLYFVDPVKRVIAVSHSGWRGTVNRMGKVTVSRMTEEYGCNAKDIYAAIGPSICQDCYEVSNDVADAFKAEFAGLENTILKQGKQPDKYYLDLWKANELILLDAGIEKDHIECANFCTCCNSDYLFSHRATGGKRGNLAAFLMLTADL